MDVFGLWRVGRRELKRGVLQSLSAPPSTLTCTHITTFECPLHLSAMSASFVAILLLSTYAVQHVGLVPLQVSRTRSEHHPKANDSGECSLE